MQGQHIHKHWIRGVHPLLDHPSSKSQDAPNSIIRTPAQIEKQIADDQKTVDWDEQK